MFVLVEVIIVMIIALLMTVAIIIIVIVIVRVVELVVFPVSGVNVAIILHNSSGDCCISSSNCTSNSNVVVPKSVRFSYSLQ